MSNSSVSQSVKITIHDLSRGGNGVGKKDSGEVVFVPYSAPGDELLVQITKSKKNFSEGEIVEILKPSPLRLTPPCPVFKECGGCSWQHLPYSLQFETKKKGLIQALNRAEVKTDGIELDEFPATHLYHYRNRIQIHGDPTLKKIGFFGRGTNELVPIEKCEIVDSRINEALPKLAALGFSKFKEEFKLEIEVMPNGTVRHRFNEPHASMGFRQVNDEQNSKLQNWVKEHLSSADLLLDLYGGSGNLSLPLADQFSEIRCIDSFVPSSSPERIAHFEFFRKDVRAWSHAPESKNDFQKEASFILDPPRAGLGSLFSEIEHKISKYRIKSLILVGCDVDSFARDTSNFLKSGYKLKRLGALDLFPQTPHVESLALFHK